MKHFLSIILFSLAVVPCLRAEVETKEVVYQAGETALHGFLAVPENEEKAPGILVVHEWWGHNDYARKRATMLAELGYTALAVDMYGEGKNTSHPKDAGAFSQAVVNDPEAATARFTAALEFLKQQPSVDSKKIGAIGYCFGGAVVLNMARLGVDLEGVVSFHGALDSFVEGKSPIKTRILVCHGADDGFIPTEKIEAFKEEMKASEADMEFISYPRAKHSFTNPGADAKAKEFGIDLAYDKEADTKSWIDMQKFFKATFE
ncbi:MAG: dienelactone hydrolase family protein [Verrucomicrobiota bacterium]